MLITIIGAEQSGKSRLAEKISTHFPAPKRFYIATMQNLDSECAKKIEKHRSQRKNLNFHTLEIPKNLASNKNIFKKTDLALLECVSNLLANEQFDNFDNNTSKINPADKIIDDIRQIYANLDTLIIVTNDVFHNGYNYTKECLEYMRNLAKINIKLAEMSDIFIESSTGIPIIYKGEDLYNEILDRKF